MSDRDEWDERAKTLLLACPKCGGQPFASAPDIGRVMCCQPYAAPSQTMVTNVASALRSAAERSAGDREAGFVVESAERHVDACRKRGVYPWPTSLESKLAEADDGDPTDAAGRGEKA